MNKQCTNSACRKKFSTRRFDGKCPYCGKGYPSIRVNKKYALELKKEQKRYIVGECTLTLVKKGESFAHGRYVTLSRPVVNEIFRIGMNQGNKIAAVKYLRSLTGLSLRESKEIIEFILSGGIRQKTASVTDTVPSVTTPDQSYRDGSGFLPDRDASARGGLSYMKQRTERVWNGPASDGERADGGLRFQALRVKKRGEGKLQEAEDRKKTRTLLLQSPRVRPHGRTDLRCHRDL